MEKIMSTTIESMHGTSVHEITDAELLEVTGGTGGKPNPGSLSFSHYYDQASPIILIQ
jgi:hypothetical protein